MSGRLRITGGDLVRRLIDVPPAADRDAGERGALRPTSDKVRQALFSSLQSRFDLDDRDVVDCFCGSGALGFEALSRGGRSCVFVDDHKPTLRVVEASAKKLGVDDVCGYVDGDALRFLRTTDERFDLVLLDPPYRRDVDGELTAAVVRVCRPGAVVVLERSKKSPDLAIDGLSLVDERRYGDTRVDVYQRDAEPLSSGPAPAGPGSISESSPGEPPATPLPGRSGPGTPLEPGRAATGVVVGNRTKSAAIYPGSFDPLTNGHVDIVQRGLRMFDRVIVAVANNPQKQHFFSAEERIALARESIGDMAGLEFQTFDGLVVDFAKKNDVNVLLRGVRAVSDFEYEFQLAGMNRKLSGVETIFMVTSEDSFYVASRLVKEVAGFGGDVSSMVPPAVLRALTERYQTSSQAKNTTKTGTAPEAKKK